MRPSDKAIEALQNNDCKQGFCKTELDGCFCAMGVLCLSYETDTGNVLDRFLTSRGYELGQSAVHLYPEVLEYYGIKPEGARRIEVLNDGVKLTFADIAAQLIAQPERYFRGYC